MVDAAFNPSESSQPTPTPPVLGDPPSLSDDLSAQSLNISISRRINPVVAAALKLQEHVRPEALPPSTAMAAAETLNAIQSSARTLCGALGFIAEFKRLATPGAHRITEDSDELILAAISHLKSRRNVNVGSNEFAPLEEGETRLLGVYERAFRNYSRPTWFKSAHPLFQLIGICRNLPGPEAYLEESLGSAVGTSDLREKYSSLKLSQENFRLQNGSPDAELQDDILDAKDELDGILARTNDVDPRTVPSVGELIMLHPVPRNELLTALLDFQVDISAMVADLTLRSAESPPSTFRCVEIIGQKPPGGDFAVVSGLEIRRIDALPLRKEEIKTQVLEALVEEYTALREALTAVYRDISDLPVSRDEGQRAIKRRLDSAMTSVLLEDTQKSNDVLSALASLRSPKISHALTKLLTGQTVSGGTRDKSLDYFLDKTENIKLLGHAVEILLLGTEQDAALIAERVGTSTLRPIVTLGMRVRELFQKERWRDLTRLLDDELVRLSGTAHSSPTEKAVLLHTLSTVANDETLRKTLRGFLKNIEAVAAISQSLLSGTTRENSAFGKFVESTRAKITQRFSPDLSDYWGNRELIAQVKQMIDNHLVLLEHAHVRVGHEASDVFFNGYLFYGDPGGGKSFLVECIASHYNLPMNFVSREEMERAFSAASKDGKKSESELESTLAEFMQDKIAKTNELMRKTGAKAAILFMDEMEAEFSKRDPATSGREERIRTNIMLRVIEKCIKKNENILFLGATNHIDQVDPAALRLGRYGLHFEVKLPDAEDIDDIFQHVLEKWSIGVDKQDELSPKLETLLKSCEGMTPLGVKLSVNNAIMLARAKGENTSVLSELLLDKIIEGVTLTKQLIGLNPHSGYSEASS